MKYALLIYDVPEAWGGLSDERRNAVFGEYFAVAQTPGVVGGEQLLPVETATTIRVKDGETLTTDGPFADTKEFLGGFFLLEADNLDSAIEIASRIPAARMGGSWRSAPSWSGSPDRAGLPRGVGPHRRLSGRLPRRLRPRRGSRPGGVRDRR